MCTKSPVYLIPWKKACGTTANHMDLLGGGQRAAAWKNHVEKRPTTWTFWEEAIGQQHGKIMWKNGQPHGPFGRRPAGSSMEKSCGKTANHMDLLGGGQRAAAWKNHVEKWPTTWTNLILVPGGCAYRSVRGCVFFVSIVCLVLYLHILNTIRVYIP